MNEAEAFARATRRSRRLRFVVLAAVLAAPFGYFAWKIFANHEAASQREAEYRKSLELSAPERSALATSIAEARKALTSARDGWSRAVTPEALASVQPGADACPIRLIAPTSQAAESYVMHGSIDMNYSGNISFRSYAAGAPLPPTDLDAALTSVDEVAAKLAANTADRDDAERIRKLEGRVLFVVVDQQVEAFVTASSTGIGSYTPGRLVGTAFVYSYPTQRITCAGRLEVDNAESIKFEFSHMKDNPMDIEPRMREAAKAVLGRDLEVRVKQAIASNLRSVAL